MTPRKLYVACWGEIVANDFRPATIEDAETGRKLWVSQEDYAALAADLSQMTAWGRGLETDKRLLAEKNAALAAENERLNYKLGRLLMAEKEWELVEPGEYARIKSENERLRKQIHENGLDVHLAECRANGSEEELIYIRESNERLKAENERLRKAGDAMYNAAVQDSTGLWLTKPFEDWAKAKEGR